MSDPTTNPREGTVGDIAPLLEAVGEFPAARFGRIYDPGTVADLAALWASLSLEDRALLGEKAAAAPDSSLGDLAAELRGGASPVDVAAPEAPRLTVAQTKEQVGDNVEAAQIALDAELTSGDPRSTLVAYLQDMVDATNPDPTKVVGSVHDTLGVDADDTL